MAVAKITGDGLVLIAIVVTLLWGCFIAERLTVRNARLETSRVLHDLRLMQIKKKSEPVSSPKPRIERPLRRELG